METNTTGAFRLNGINLRTMSRRKGIKSINAVSRRSGISYPTTYRYFEKPEEVESISLRALYSFLTAGIGLTSDEIANMRLGDILEQVDQPVT